MADRTSGDPIIQPVSLVTQKGCFLHSKVCRRAKIRAKWREKKYINLLISQSYHMILGPGWLLGFSSVQPWWAVRWQGLQELVVHLILMMWCWMLWSQILRVTMWDGAELGVHQPVCSWMTETFPHLYTWIGRGWPYFWSRCFNQYEWDTEWE